MPVSPESRAENLHNQDWDLTKYTQRRIRSKVGIYTGKSNNKYPIERVAEYRDIMIEGIPEIGHEIFIEDTSKQKLIKSVLYFHKCSTKLVQKKLSSNIDSKWSNIESNPTDTGLNLLKIDSALLVILTSFIKQSYRLYYESLYGNSLLLI